MIGWSAPSYSPAPVVPEPSPESDDSLLSRVLYVGSDGPQTTQAITHARAEKLDEWAWRFGLKRRKQ